MKYADLMTLKYNGLIKMDEASLLAPAGAAVINQPASFRVAGEVTGGKTLELKIADGGPGIWVPYLARRNIYGFMDGAASWAASGPYSGCYFEVGASGGRTYVAHISREGENDANLAAWDTCAELGGKTVLFKKRIRMAKNVPTGMTASQGFQTIIFAAITGAAVAATRIDILTDKASGMSGRILNVEAITS
ncbi:MAG: hypothetical protein JWQ97_2011, partial [Phenylobacterium sp.]|nr:hypothetical protein [Phenylobacterium sp.]